MISGDRVSPLGITIARLTRAFQWERGLTCMLGGWLAGVPYWDAKLAVGEHLWEHATLGSRLLKRLGELKEAATTDRHEAGTVAVALRMLTAAPDGDAFLTGTYGVWLPGLASTVERWADETDPIMDPMSRRLFGEMAELTREHAQWWIDYRPGYSAHPVKVDAAWTSRIGELFHSVDFESDAWLADRRTGPELAVAPAFEGIATPRRDPCFRTAYFNEIVRDEPESFPARRRAIFYNHTQEMQFAESLGSILYDTPEMPWAFHFDLARHCRDEIKHTRMGCARLEQLGEDLRQFPMLLQNFSLRAKLDPLERFCLMTLVIEASSFEKKRANVRLFAEHDDWISERYESHDIRDEMMHVNFGHIWVPIMLCVRQDSRSLSELIQQCRDILDDALKDERRAR